MKDSNQMEQPNRHSYNWARYAKGNGTTSNSDQTKFEDSPG
jgi:hypothetical protein